MFLKFMSGQKWPMLSLKWPMAGLSWLLAAGISKVIKWPYLAIPETFAFGYRPFSALFQAF